MATVTKRKKRKSGPHTEAVPEELRLRMVKYEASFKGVRDATAATGFDYRTLCKLTDKGGAVTRETLARATALVTEWEAKNSTNEQAQ